MNEPSVNSTARALRGLRQLGSAQLLTQLVTWCLTAITVHLLQPRDYGLLALSGIFTSLAQLLLDGGLSPVLVSQRELPMRLQGAAITAVLLLSWLLAAMIFAIAPIASSFFRSVPLRAILEVSAFYLPLTGLGVIPRAQLSKSMQFRRLARVQLIAGVAQGAFTLALAYLGAAYWALILGAMIGMGLQVSLLWANLDQKPVPNLRLTELRPLIRSTSHIVAQRLSYFAVGNLDTFLLGRMWGPAVLGPYSVARLLAHTVLEKISGVTGQVSVPAFAARTETDDQLRGLTAVISITATLVFPLFWIMGVMSQLAFPLIFGLHWVRMIIPFLMFASVLPLRTIYTLLNSSLIGTGRTGLTLKNTLSWAVILVPFILVGSIKGANGVAIGWATAFPIVFYVAMRRTAKVFAVDMLTLTRPILAPSVCAAVSVAAAEGVFLGLANRFAPMVIIVCQAVVAVISYPILLRCLSRPQYQESLSFVRRVAGV